MQGDRRLPLSTSLPRGPEKGWREVDGDWHTEDGVHGCWGRRPANHPHQAGEGHLRDKLVKATPTQVQKNVSIPNRPGKAGVAPQPPETTAREVTFLKSNKGERRASPRSSTDTDDGGRKGLSVGPGTLRPINQ